MTANMTANTTEGAATVDRRRLIGPAAGAVVLLAGGALLWLMTQVTQRDWAPPRVDVEFSGERYRIDADDLGGFEAFSTLYFSEGEQGARAFVAAEIGAQLDGIFAQAQARLPEFADWYYSLRGEYSRLGMAALSFAGLADPGYVAAQAAAMLLPDDVWSESLRALENQTTARLRAYNEQVRDGWLADLASRLQTHRVPAPSPAAVSEEPIRVDALLQQIVAREQQAFETRISLSTAVAAGGAAATPALLRAVGATQLAARAAGRGASRVGTAAVGGAALCSLAGPVALGCALVAGATAWLATDWAMLRAEEYFQRDELVGALAEGLIVLRAQIEADLLAAYDEVIAAHYAAVESDIRRTFVPARAGEVTP